MQRAAFDLTGIAADSDDQRQWLWQACWPIDRFPLRRDFEASPKWEPGEEDYGFVRVEGDGVHEIPVGPVHAGIIEPGHFRFQVVGEKVLRLEERLGYTHKGIEKRFEALAHRRRRIASPAASPATAPSRTPGPMRRRVEAIAGVALPPRAAWLRALALERERLANHLGDLGYLGNDCGFAFGLAQFSRLKEDVLRTNVARVRPPDDDGLRRPGRRRVRPRRRARGRHARRVHAARARDRARCATSTTSTPDLQDRVRTCGIVTPELAAQARAPRPRGARERAARATCAVISRSRPTTCSTCAMATQSDGDVAARVAVRFDEAQESLRLIRVIVDSHAGRAASHAALPEPPPFKARAGLRRRLARAGLRRARERARADRSAAAIRTIRRGRAGRCSSTR